MRLGNHFDGDPWADGVDQFGRVPVGETEATVGAGARDVLGLRSSVDAVALERESDPSGADWVIGSRGQDQFIGDALFGGHVDEDFGIESIIGVGSDINDSKGLIGDLIFIGCDRAREAGDDFITGIKSEESGLGKHDNDSRHGGEFSSSV